MNDSDSTSRPGSDPLPVVTNENCGCGPEGCDPRTNGLQSRKADEPVFSVRSLPALPLVSRRDFLRTAAAGTAMTTLSASGLPFVAGPFFPTDDPDHFVPVDKKLSTEWIEALFQRGAPVWYEGGDLDTIGMPVGGLCAGQVYLAGDGRLVGWDIFNRNRNTGYGATNYADGRPAETTVVAGEIVPMEPVRQGFSVTVVDETGTKMRTLDRQGFPDVRFRGEYPIGRVAYGDPAFPVSVEMEAFSPFVPLETEDSTLPVVIMAFKVRNISTVPVRVTLTGWLENAVGIDHIAANPDRIRRENQPSSGPGHRGVLMSAVPLDPARPAEREPDLFEDFNGDSYGAWVVEGEAFGEMPARGTLEGQSAVTGFEGRGLVNTFIDGDGPTGRLVSPAFTIKRPFISFLIGGGRNAERTCINLLVDGAVARTETGNNNERLLPANWEVSDLIGREARIEIVDSASGGWGHINVDRIEFRDAARVIDPGTPETWTDWGTMALAVLDPRPSSAGEDYPQGVGAVSSDLELGPGAEAVSTFVIAWHMPNLYRSDRLVSNRYAARFRNAGAIVRYVADHSERLSAGTRAWRDTWYDSTLPVWLLDRIHSTVSNLATNTVQWWADGRFWAWEGAGCCHGTCGHVWNYEHAMARLFPDLERSVRERQDFADGVGLHEDGSIAFRGEDWSLWAGDSQGGYVMKALREHQMSPDAGFLERNWPAIKRATAFLLGEDGNDDGLLEGAQHQTYDEFYYGPNTMVGSFYLGALRAAEEMATTVGDESFAARCRRVFENGSRQSVDRLFNGEYFIQDVDLSEHPDAQYADGCLADQLIGQGWAHETGLGYLYPRETVAAALASIWKYCWAPDVGPQNKAHPPERWFAYPGEAGLFTCTWPKSMHLGQESTRYRNEIWTGIEYQVAGHMAREGLVTEALAICRAIHERYHPSRHNPYNEIECGDHYARSMASWMVLTGLSGFEYDGPAGHIGFAPRISPDDFRCAFTAAEGWGSFEQRRDALAQTLKLDVRHGRVALKTFATELAPEARRITAAAAIKGRILPVGFEVSGGRCVISFMTEIVVQAGENLEIVLSWS